MIGTSEFFNSDAHLTNEGIALYVDALLSDRVYYLPGAVLRHVAECMACKSEIVETYSLFSEQEGIRREAHPYFGDSMGAKEGKFSLVYRIAAVLIVGIGVGVIGYNLRIVQDERVVPKKQVEVADSLLKENPEASQGVGGDVRLSLADNYVVSPNLENLINTGVRSSRMRVLSPTNGEVLKQRVRFSWEKGGDLMILKILSNKEKIIKMVTMDARRYLIVDRLQPGLYYWKLENNDELLYVGKFFVR